MKPYLFSVLILSVTTRCDKDKVIRTSEEEHIHELAYSEDYTYSAGFNHEIYEPGSLYYENTVSIRPLTKRDNVWIELNINEKNEARLWSDKSIRLTLALLIRMSGIKEKKSNGPRKLLTFRF
jgi:hypothetical protein